MLFLKRNLMFILLAAFIPAAWSQQPGTMQPAGWPQILFWSVNPYNLQPQLWMQQTGIPRPGTPGALPFPTPFWLWTLPPQPSSLVQPLPSVSIPTTPSPPAVPAVPVDTIPADTPPTTSPVTHAATSSEALLSPTTENDASIIKSETTPETTSQTIQTIVPIEDPRGGSTIDAPLTQAPIDQSIAQTAAVQKPETEVSTLKRARTAKKKTSKRVRKLCWKDGTLDVCP